MAELCENFDKLKRKILIGTLWQAPKYTLPWAELLPLRHEVGERVGVRRRSGLMGKRVFRSLDPRPSDRSRH
jgi:hypothetical protein